MAEGFKIQILQQWGRNFGFTVGGVGSSVGGFGFSVPGFGLSIGGFAICLDEAALTYW